MKFCSKCGKEILDEAIICPACGCAVTPAAPTQYAQAPSDDSVSGGLVVLSVLIPLFGIIYWPLKHKETPKKAKACGIAALISWGISFFFTIIFTTILAGIGMSYM